MRDARVQRRSAVLGLAGLALLLPGMRPEGARTPIDTGQQAAAASGARTTPQRLAPQGRFPKPLTDAQLDVFRGFGAWIDLFDVDLSVEDYIARMKRSGVRTLYIQTGRSNTEVAVDPRVGPWLAAAHRAGMKVVGWYLPMYTQPRVDLRRTVMIQRFRHGSHRFDGIGIDIEYRAAVSSLSIWNRRVAEHLAAVRAKLGPGYPIASIPPPPLQMRVAPEYWAGFPWKALGRHTDAVMLMSYWSARTGCPRVRIHCAYEFTANNISLTRQLIGRDDRIIHIIGGVGNAIDERELKDFVRGALDGAADGASIYDARTTRDPWWKDLSQLRRLGNR